MTGTVLALLLLAAQDPPPAMLPMLLLPSENGAWVVRIETSGGFTGRGLGNYTASSSGELKCASLTRQVPCPDRLVPETQQSISRLVTAIPAVTISAPPGAPGRGTICNDCVTTTMTVRRRNGDGEQAASYRWDESTIGSVPGEVLRLHAAVIALASPRIR